MPKDTVRSVWDNGGRTVDRYAILFDAPASWKGPGWYEAILASHRQDPGGVYMHEVAEEGEHLGTQITLDDLPEALRKNLFLDFGV